MQIDNQTVGQNISKFRKLKDIKAADIANQLGMKEAAYTKHERGETSINIDFVQKVAKILDINPLAIISASPDNFLQSITNSSVAIQGNSTLQNTNDKHTELMLKLLENVTMVNERLLTLLERKN